MIPLIGIAEARQGKWSKPFRFCLGFLCLPTLGIVEWFFIFPNDCLVIVFLGGCAIGACILMGYAWSRG